MSSLPLGAPQGKHSSPTGTSAVGQPTCEEWQWEYLVSSALNSFGGWRNVYILVTAFDKQDVVPLSLGETEVGGHRFHTLLNISGGIRIMTISAYDRLIDWLFVFINLFSDSNYLVHFGFVELVGTVFNILFLIFWDYW